MDDGRVLVSAVAFNQFVVPIDRDRLFALSISVSMNENRLRA